MDFYKSIPLKYIKIFRHKINEGTFHTLPHLKCIRFVSLRSSHLPFQMHLLVSVRSSHLRMNKSVRIELTQNKKKICTLSLKGCVLDLSLTLRVLMTR